jgi:8-oxo-dGTP pyrophosphatase MutT (NUDIX family)
MSSGPPDSEIISIDRVEIMLERQSWEFAIKRRGEIDRYFAHLKGKRPLLWNGQKLLTRRYAVRDGVLRGTCFETDYASFLAWRDWDFPDPGVYDVFAAAALCAADGAYLVGQMAQYTASAGRIGFPSGTPEPADIDAGGMLDLLGNLRRELKEETGIDMDECRAEVGWALVRGLSSTIPPGCVPGTSGRGSVGLMKRVTAPAKAVELRSSIMQHLASNSCPEFTDIRIVRGRADLDQRMTPFVVAFLERVWRP